MMIIPVASKDCEEPVMCALENRVFWVGILLEGGTIKHQDFYDSLSAIPTLVDYIIEAFIFKELHQLGA